MEQARCWHCAYCDKESVLKNGQWVLTKTGYCLSEKSAANGQDSFYQKVYIDTVQPKCNFFKKDN